MLLQMALFHSENTSILPYFVFEMFDAIISISFVKINEFSVSAYLGSSLFHLYF